MQSLNSNILRVVQATTILIQFYSWFLLQTQYALSLILGFGFNSDIPKC